MGFWRTLGKIASIAAPIVAAPFTGGASLALIGAGAGAAHGALSGGGVKGALLGAGLGAIPGVGAAKGAATGVKSGLEMAGKSVLSHPGTILNAAGDIAGGLGALEQGRADGRVTQAGVNQAQDRNSIGAAAVNLGAGAHRGAQAVQGDVMANAQPFKWTGDNQMVGNIPVPQFSGGVSPGIFSDNTRKLGAQLSADALAGQTADHGNVASLTPLPEAGKMDSILSTASSLGSLASLIPYQTPRRIGQNNPPQQPNPWVNYQPPSFTGWA